MKALIFYLLAIEQICLNNKDLKAIISAVYSAPFSSTASFTHDALLTQISQPQHLRSPSLSSALISTTELFECFHLLSFRNNFTATFVTFNNFLTLPIIFQGRHKYPQTATSASKIMFLSSQLWCWSVPKPANDITLKIAIPVHTHTHTECTSTTHINVQHTHCTC